MYSTNQQVPELNCYQWLCDLSFLADIMNYMNELNLHPQVAEKFVSTLYNQVKAFRRKLEMLQKQLKNKDQWHFSAYKKLVEEDLCVQNGLMLLRSEKYSNTFENLQKEFQQRFCNFCLHDHDIYMFADTFHCDPERTLTNEQLELIELQESSDLKSSFRDLSLEKFYSLLSALTYPALRNRATRMASLFGSNYICEKTFSVMNFSKLKWQTVLTNKYLSLILQISTSNYKPRYAKLLAKRSQLHFSHITFA